MDFRTHAMRNKQIQINRIDSGEISINELHLPFDRNTSEKQRERWEELSTERNEGIIELNNINRARVDHCWFVKMITKDGRREEQQQID